ncbi:MAG: Fic family protein [Firmicutes bacterium]|nr:Fic family protein [Bacillota bacterium]
MHDDIATKSHEPIGFIGGTTARLGAALATPLQEFAGLALCPTIWDKVAALIFGVAVGHPFISANKRTATALGFLTFPASSFGGSRKTACPP